jgi:SAM-dependent methyltransferase
MRYNRLLPAEWHGRRKAWEIQTAWDTLDNYHAVRDDAEILGVGAGQEHTLFMLSNYVKRVFATDLYAEAGAWKNEANRQMLIDPATCAPTGMAFDPRHIVVQHMDMRDLRYPDNTFDGIFSSSSIEHVGGWEDVKQAAREIGRVLKPGGICSLSTEFKLTGKGDGWPGVLLFTPDRIEECIVEPSGLVQVDSPDYLSTDEHIQNAVSLERMVFDHYNPEREIAVRSETHGYVFTSVHLALLKV